VIPGRVTVTARALTSTFAAIAADELGIRRRDVRAQVSDSRGRLQVRIDTPVTLAPLGDGGPGRSAGPTVTDLIDRLRQRLTDEGGAITGSTVGEVQLHITDARIDQPRRVS
jgi:hypothetical protein